MKKLSSVKISITRNYRMVSYRGKYFSEATIKGEWIADSNGDTREQAERTLITKLRAMGYK